VVRKVGVHREKRGRRLKKKKPNGKRATARLLEIARGGKIVPRQKIEKDPTK